MMRLREILDLQREFDREHGWEASSPDTQVQLAMIEQDLIGLVGEVGEFSNVVKRLRLDRNRLTIGEFEARKFRQREMTPGGAH